MGNLSCELIFDGGSVGNPGDSYGSFRWRLADGPLTKPGRRRFGYGTNNQAEYKALIEGLRSLLTELSTIGTRPADVDLDVQETRFKPEAFIPVDAWPVLVIRLILRLGRPVLNLGVACALLGLGRGCACTPNDKTCQPGP